MTEQGIIIERDGDYYIAYDDVTLMYGIGDTPEEARADYEESVRELIEALREHGSALDSPHLVAAEWFAQQQGIDIG